jgi:hypothetical protein
LAAINAGEDDTAREALELFVDIAELQASFLKPYLQPIFTAMVNMCTNPDMDDSVKQLALEFLVTLAESKPGLVRKFPKYVETVVPIVINFMLEVEENSRWNEGTFLHT